MDAVGAVVETRALEPKFHYESMSSSLNAVGQYLLDLPTTRIVQMTAIASAANA